MSELEEMLALLIKKAGLPEPVREYRFTKIVRSKFDFAWPAVKLGVEVQGGTWVKSGHTTGTGLDRDYRKLNIAQAGGWKVLMFNKQMIKSGYAVEMIKEILSIGDKQ